MSIISAARRAKTVPHGPCWMENLCREAVMSLKINEMIQRIYLRAVNPPFTQTFYAE